ncbi:fimbrial protein [Siccibacter colletis]|uniref:fimbrial protein n=1 Tax=Siccibacter colletis TaxID=1505757 RepID=UPI0009DCCA8A|nr:fimbrial protein [Siccibacter colletis]
MTRTLFRHAFMITAKLKLKMISTLITAIAFGSLISLPGYASDSSMSLTATVLASPCTFDSDVSKLTVDLGDYYADELYEPRKTIAYTTFPLALKDCPQGTTSVVATFNGVNDASNDWIPMFKNTGTAQNVGIALKGSQAPWVGGALKNGDKLTQLVKADHTVSWPMEVQIGTYTGNATPGTVHASVTVSFTYQ